MLADSESLDPLTCENKQLIKSELVDIWVICHAKIFLLLFLLFPVLGFWSFYLNTCFILKVSPLVCLIELYTSSLWSFPSALIICSFLIRSSCVSLTLLIFLVFFKPNPPTLPFHRPHIFPDMHVFSSVLSSPCCFLDLIYVLKFLNFAFALLELFTLAGLGIPLLNHVCLNTCKFAIR